jgi:peptidoglycan/LPS O-acetylase OafA/YrhL
MVLLAGMMGIQLGAMIMALGAQNRATDADARRFGWMYVYAGGILVAMAAIVAMEFVAHPNRMHGSNFYKVTAGIFPLLLLAVARASRLRWGATITAAVYMGILMVMIWILQLFPATPKLAPIYNPVTHMVPLPFPLLLVLPAVALDLLMHRLRDRREWLLAARRASPS